MRMELIEWVDSSFTSGWKRKEDIEDKVFKSVSCGATIRENDEIVILALSMGEDDQVCDTMKIPKCSITRRRRLEVRTHK